MKLINRIEKTILSKITEDLDIYPLTNGEIINALKSYRSYLDVPYGIIQNIMHYANGKELHEIFTYTITVTGDIRPQSQADFEDDF